MSRRLAVLLALFLSGLSALVFELVWTRLLGLVFGTTSEAIGTVLAVFFGGLAIGNLVAARLAHRVRRPFRLYALLELGIGAFALASVPLLRAMDGIYAWVGTDHGAFGFAAIRVGAAAAVLLPPTVAMGATLPVVARGIIAEDRVLGRWSAFLYAANTLGSVAGAYLTGFWLIPGLGVTRTVVAAACVNLLVAAGIGAVGRGATATFPPRPAAKGPVAGAARGRRLAFLAFFGLSGFVAIGYEMVWSKLFGIFMEGTLYGFSAVLSGYLLGIAVGSAVMGPFVDRIRDLPRAFALLHVATALAVVGTLGAVPLLPYVQERLIALLGGGDPTQLLLLLALPVVLLPTALFGAAFPVLIRIHTPQASRVAQGLGAAVAVNTAGSIAASLLLGFVALPTLGMDATLFALLLLDLLVALVVLVVFQRAEGVRALSATGAAAVAFLLLSLSFNGVQVERVLATQQVQYHDLAEYRDRVEDALSRHVAVIEGRNVVVSVTDHPWGRMMRSNGLVEAASLLGPPYRPVTATLLGLLPYLVAEGSERALVVGLGGGNTLDALRATRLERLEVVELEPAVVEAVGLLHEGRPHPLDDPRVRLTLNDGRNELLLRTHREAPGFDLITSQPSHPWLMGAANLFTEEFFRLARANLHEGGVFALWVNGFRTDAESLIAIAASFERVFPGAVLVDVSSDHDRRALMLLGGRGPLRLPVARMRARLAEPGVRAALAPLGFGRVEELLARFEGPAAALAALRPDAANTDDRAFVETRLPRLGRAERAPFAALDAELPADTPLLPPSEGPGHVDAWALAHALAGLDGGAPAPPAKLRRLARAHRDALGAARAEVLDALAAARAAGRPGPADVRLRDAVARHGEAPWAWRLLGRFLARARGRLAEAAEAYGRAFARSGAPEDARDAGLALGRVDPEAAWRWLARIPPARRAAWPEVAYFEARRRLARGAPPEALRASREAVARLRVAPEGRGRPEVDALLAQLCAALGDEEAARAHADAAARGREGEARGRLAAMRAALAGGGLARAHALLEQARRLAPAHPEVLEAAIALARRTRDPAALRAALAEARRWAPDPAAAIAAENRLRRELGLPLLPPRPAEELAGPAPGAAGRGAGGSAHSARSDGSSVPTRIAGADDRS